MKEIAIEFVQLGTELLENEHAQKLKSMLSDLSKIFTQWSVSYGNQYNFFKEDFRNVFKYMDYETQEMCHIYKNYITFKDEYEDFTYRINKRKEELFERKDYSKWSLAPGTESQLSMFKNNRKIAMEKMLYRETILLAEEKKRVACTIHYLFRQFDKMLIYQTVDLEKYLKNLKENNKLVVADGHNLLKLFSLIKEDQGQESEQK